MKNVELISHPLCPFNQRLIITLLMKGQKRDKDFFVRYIDLADIPDWFYKLSPKAEMPLLIIGEQITLFKTNPINEFLNEYTSGDLHSGNEIVKAQDRYWIEYAGDILTVLRDVFTSQQSDSFHKSIHQLFELFEPVENHLDLKSKYWRNQHHTLVDGAFIPAFTLMFHFNYFRDLPSWQRLPKTFYWANELMETSFAMESKCPGYAEEFDHFFSLMNSKFEDFTKTSNVV